MYVSVSGFRLKMDESAGAHSRRVSQEGSLPASSSPLSTHSSTQTSLQDASPPHPPWMNKRQMEQNQDSQDQYVEMHSSPYSGLYEELFCTSQTSNTPIPLAGALMISSKPQSDVQKQGYLGKQERSHRRYFALRAGSHTGPSRLEWYKNQEKFTEMEKSAGKAALSGSSKQGVIYLRCCLGVSRSGSSRKGHMVALYAKDQTMVLVAEDQWEQEQWYLTIKKLMEEERKADYHGGGFEENCDVYCTLPPAAFFKEVWPVTVKPRGLGCSKSLAGESRLCLTAMSLILIRVAACSDLLSVTIPLLSVRRFGHSDGLFFMEIGRSAPNGPGEIWMEARDQGNPAAAQHIHEVVRDTVRAQRALPDFGRSPISSHIQLQALLASKRCRPKYRDEPVNVRPLGSCPLLHPSHPEIQTSPTKCYQDPQKPKPESTLSSDAHLSPIRSSQSFKSETGSYMEMNSGRQNDGRRPAMVTGDYCGMDGWEPAGKQQSRYMMMSPQVSHSPVRLQDEYMTMASPQKHNESAHSPLHTSFSGSTSDSDSPLHPQHGQTSEHSHPHWLLKVQQRQTDAVQSQRSISCSTRPQDDERQQSVMTSADQRRLSAQTGATSSPVRSGDGSGVMAPFVTSAPSYNRPVQASSYSGTGCSSRLQAASDRSVRRNRLFLCLPSCLQAKNRS